MLKVLVLLLLNNALTQFSCDFETPAQRQAWTLNAGDYGTDCANRWYIDSAGANLGHYGLFISNDGTNATYSNTLVGGVVSYTTLDMESKDYTLSFNWQSLGFQKDTTSDYADRLYVCWIPTKDNDGNPVGIGSSTRELPLFAKDYALQPEGSKRNYLAGSQSWATAQFTISSSQIDATKGPYRLAFVWTNGDSMAVSPPAMVDNIEIIPANACPAPTNLSYTLVDQKIQINWSGTAESYEVRCYNHESKRTYPIDWPLIVKDTMVEFDNIPEGRVDIYVRAVCGEWHSPEVSTSGLIYYPGTRCINFLDLKDAKTYISQDFALTTDPITFTEKLVDFGYASSYSRHTVHYNREERDAQTNYGLPTVPDDEIASVRLGNWRTGTECERIEYTLHIDAEVNPVLVLKYAIVMENPDGHSTYEQPRFTLRILKNGKSVGNHCVEADFTADGVDTAQDKSWHRWNPHTSAASADIVWKEWTSVGVDLSEYNGEDLVVQLTSYDCSQSGHFGYVYFTLSCSNGKFKDMACGQVNPIFYAPAGFQYRWYAKNKPDSIISRIDTLYVGYQDTTVYGCDLMFPKDTDCYFTLYADAMARFPIPEMKYVVSHDCNNMVTLYEKSHLLIHNHISGKDTHDYKQYCDYTEWTLHDGTTSRDAKIVKEYPPEGGTFPIKLHAAYITCDSIDTVYITLPDVRATSDTLHKEICNSETPFYFPSEEAPDRLELYETGKWPYTVKNQYGCDSTTVVDLSIVENKFVTQRWNDVLAVRNSKYNGGYNFVAYQWLKNSTLLSGETNATLYVPNGLDTTAIYTVRLTRDDGVMMESCPFRPKKIKSQDVPTVVQKGQSISLRGKGTATFYSALGCCVSTQTYNNSSVEAPLTSGLFILYQIDEQADSQTQYMIIH